VSGLGLGRQRRLLMEAFGRSDRRDAGSLVT